MAQEPQKPTENLPPKGYASPLEGVFGPEIVAMLGVAYAGISMNMVQNLGMKMGPALKQGQNILSGLNSNAPKMGMPEMKAPSGLSAPKPKGL